jgi:hypothetical protein
VLPTRIPLKMNRFSEGDWQILRFSGHPCWLLAFPNGRIEDFEYPVQEYLKEGLRRGVHMTPTARKMRTWFSIPIPSSPPDIFATYMFHGAPRFIINEARVLHLTNILGGRFIPNALSEISQKNIAELLNTQAMLWVKNKLPMREYRGGLRKIEPRELSNLPINEFIFGLDRRDKQAATRSLF